VNSKRFVATAFLGFALALAFSASAQPNTPDDGLQQQEQECTTNVGYFRARIDSATEWSNIFMVLGATVAALGSALAGFLNSTKQRKVAAVVGALGAVVTVLPKTLPDKQDLQTKLTAAERQRVVGTKVRNQFQFAGPDESLTEAKKYVSARFTDCASLAPPEQVPDLPKGTSRPADLALPAPVAPEPSSATAQNGRQMTVSRSPPREPEFSPKPTRTADKRTVPFKADNFR
jgi:hypothetical protein